MGAGDGMQSDNFTQALKDAGLRSPSKLDKVWDVNFSMGGPIMRDQVVVLRDPAQHGELPLHLGHLLQQERGQSQPGLLVLRSGPEPAGPQRPEMAGRVAAADVAGDAAQQVHGFLERAAAESRAGGGRQPHDLARGERRDQGPGSPGVPGRVDGAGVEPRAGRGGVLGPGRPLQPGEAGQQQETSRSSRSRPGRSRSDRTSGGPPCPGRRVRARTWRT